MARTKMRPVAERGVLLARPVENKSIRASSKRLSSRLADASTIATEAPFGMTVPASSNSSRASRGVTPMERSSAGLRHRPAAPALRGRQSSATACAGSWSSPKVALAAP